MTYLYLMLLKTRRTPVLCCPGPVQLHRKTKWALARTQMCHRDVSFEELHTRTAANIYSIARVSPDSHKIVFITGSGTSANEAMIAAIGKLGQMLVISNGEFGERIYNLAVLHHRRVSQLSFKWGKKVNLRSIEKVLATGKYASIVVVHHETSTGMLNPVAKIAKLAHAHNALICVDAVSSLGAEVFEAQRWKIDVFTSSSGKALSSVPGIGIVGVSKETAERIVNLKKTVQSLDLTTYILYADRLKQTPHTPSVHALAALHASTKRILNIGLFEYQATIRRRAENTRRHLRKMGLSYFDYGGPSTSSVITCVKRSSNMHISDLLTYMRSRGVVFYSGKGELENTIFQIGHIGELSPLTMRCVIRILDMYVATLRNAADTYKAVSITSREYQKTLSKSKLFRQLE